MNQSQLKTNIIQSNYGKKVLEVYTNGDKKQEEGNYTDINELHSNNKKGFHEAVYEAFDRLVAEQMRSENIWWNENVRNEIQKNKELYFKWFNNEELSNRREYVKQRSRVNKMNQKH